MSKGRNEEEIKDFKNQTATKIEQITQALDSHMQQNQQLQAHLDKQAEIEGRLVEKVEQLREMRSAFRNILENHLSLACTHLNIDKPELQEIADFEKLAYRVGAIYGLPDADRRHPGAGNNQQDEVFHSLRIALEELIRLQQMGNSPMHH